MTCLADPPAPENQQLTGYTFGELLYQSHRTRVYRGIATATQQAVVIKVLVSDSPHVGRFVQFRNQYSIAKDLPVEGIVAPFQLLPCGNSYALVMEDYGGISLAQYRCDQPLPLTEVLDIARQLADILGQLHHHRIIHKDLKPANILIHPVSKQVKLIDFGIASLLPKETQAITNPNSLEGTLAYLAPEQTGRMNRGIDYRADFYALGMTLYELLTGQLPFATEDPLALIHSHMAQPSPAVHTMNASVPPVVAAIVAKLSAKNAEERYQTALGLKYDLETCLMQWTQQGNIADFELGQRDVSDRFLIPEKLYGREHAVEMLLAAFDRVAKGRSELMLVAGVSGIGKTAVVNEVHKPITRQYGYFVKGKFDQFNRNIPFSAFVQAFRDLVRQLLGESDAALQRWKHQLLAALDGKAQVIVDLIPELSHIIGPQPSVPELSGPAAQNRFSLLFKKFVQACARAEHPLVIFIDDLQWVDAASLHLIEVLCSEYQSGYLLLLGAYRDNEIFPAHPLLQMLNRLSYAQHEELLSPHAATQAKFPSVQPNTHLDPHQADTEPNAQACCLNTIALKPLELSNLNHLIADTFHTSCDAVRPITALVMQKTKGNPFFVTQFLKSLRQEQLIVFDQKGGGWQCDIGALSAVSLTDDVVVLMMRCLQQLPETTQSILKLAACIGAQFDLETLSVIAEREPKDIAAALWPALQVGLILPVSQVYKFFQDSTDVVLDETLNPGYNFLHDRVQQAAYALISEEQQAATHWQIGSLLLQEASASQDKKLFDLVNQLNLGRSAIATPLQTEQLAKLNLQAGQKAQLSAAYQAAQLYCDMGLSLLLPAAWETHYRLMFDLHYHGAEAAYLSGQFERAEAIYPAALQGARTALDQAMMYRLQMTQYQLQGRNAEAIEIQRQSLALLGYALPTAPERIQAQLDDEMAVVDAFLSMHSISSILTLPKMDSAEQQEILRILQILFYAAWLDGQITLAFLSLAKMTSLSLQNGNSEMSPFGYVGYGLISKALLENASQAYQFGHTAVQLCDQFSNADVRGMTNFFFAADVHSWTQPLRDADAYYEAAYNYGMEAGNWLTVSFMMMLSGSDQLTYGRNLEELLLTAQSHADFLRQVKSLENLDALKAGVIQPVRQLLGLTASPYSFDDEHFSEAAYLTTYQANAYHLAWFYSVKIRHAYLFEQVDLYADLIPKAEIVASTIPSHAKQPSTVFYVALMHLALIGTIDDVAQQSPHWQALQTLEKKLEQWQKDSAENIRHKYLLVRAERARLQKDQVSAIELYDQSIALAQSHGYGYEAALANELAAKFYLAWGKGQWATSYLHAAYGHYVTWGATAKVSELEQRYPHVLSGLQQPGDDSIRMLNTLRTLNAETPSNLISASCEVSNLNQALDFASIFSASQMLSRTIQLDALMRQLTQIILQNSGGDRCALMLPNDAGEWQVRAIATPEETQLCDEPLVGHPGLPVQLIQYTKNTQEVVVIHDLETDLPVPDSYLQQRQPKSVLCLPILNQGNLIGILYLKNRWVPGVFSRDRITVLTFLCTQTAIALENARLYRLEKNRAVELAASEARLKALFNQAADAVFLLDEHGFIDCNQAAVNLLQYPSKEDLLSCDLAQLYPQLQPGGQSSSVGMALMMQEALQRCNLRFEWVHQRFKGSTFWSEITLTPIKYQSEVIFHCVVRDISNRKLLEQEQAILTSVLEATPDYIGIADANGHEVWCNQPLKKLRPDLADPAQQGIGDYHPQWVTDILLNTAIPAAIHNGSWAGELAVLGLDGEEIPVSQVVIAHKASDGTVENFSTVMRDIRDQKRAEANSRLLASVVESSNDAIITKNLDGIITSWNQAAVDLFGFTEAEALGQSIFIIFPEERKQEEPSIIARMRRKECIKHFETVRLHKDRTPIDISVTISPLVDGQGNVVGASKIVRDIRDRKAYAEQLEKTNAELIRATRLKDDFLATMSHELRTPLNAILGMSESLQEKILGDVNARQLNALNLIERSGNHLLNLINDILDLSKIEADSVELTLAPTDISQLCYSSLLLVQQQAHKKQIEIQTSLPAGLPLLDLDEQRMKQVLINLLSNAVKFTPEGGHVRVKVSLSPSGEGLASLASVATIADATPSSDALINKLHTDKTQTAQGWLEATALKSTNLERDDLERDDFDKADLEKAYPEPSDSEMPGIERAAITSKRYLQISIEDTGIGIAPADISKLFQPFVQIDSALNRKYEGTGLGLALVKKIVSLHGGQVLVRSQEGVGSCFVVELPWVEPAPVPNSLLPSAVAPPCVNGVVSAGTAALILLVEDDAANMMTVSSYLEAKGYRLAFAANGAEALEKVQSLSPSVVLMDIQMPVMDGLEATRRIRADLGLAEIPVIALTALAMKGDEERCLDAGANEYLSKPVKLKQLDRLLQKYLVGE